MNMFSWWSLQCRIGALEIGMMVFQPEEISSESDVDHLLCNGCHVVLMPEAEQN